MTLQNEQRIQQGMQDFISWMLISYPFYGELLQRIPVIRNDDITRTVYTDGLRIYWNEKYMIRNAPEQRAYLLVHEMLHIILGHIGAGKGRKPHLWNNAADIVTNRICDMIAKQVNGSRKLMRMQRPAEGIYCSSFGEGSDVEQVYRMLLDDEGLSPSDRGYCQSKTVNHNRIWMLQSLGVYGEAEYVADLVQDIIQREGRTITTELLEKSSLALLGMAACHVSNIEPEGMTIPDAVKQRMPEGLKNQVAGKDLPPDQKKQMVEMALQEVIACQNAGHALLGLKRLMLVDRGMVKKIFLETDSPELESYISKYRSIIGIGKSNEPLSNAGANWMSLWLD